MWHVSPLIFTENLVCRTGNDLHKLVCYYLLIFIYLYGAHPILTLKTLWLILKMMLETLKYRNFLACFTIFVSSCSRGHNTETEASMSYPSILSLVFLVLFGVFHKKSIFFFSFWFAHILVLSNNRTDECLIHLFFNFIFRYDDSTSGWFKLRLMLFAACVIFGIFLLPALVCLLFSVLFRKLYIPNS